MIKKMKYTSYSIISIIIMGCGISKKFCKQSKNTTVCSPDLTKETSYRSIKAKKPLIKVKPGNLKTIIEVKSCYEISLIIN